MAYSTTDISAVRIDRFPGGVRLHCTTTYDYVQAYMAGALIGVGRASSGSVTMDIPEPAGKEIYQLLAVDAASAYSDLYSDAFSGGDPNRIRFSIPRDRSYGITDRARVFIGEAGGDTADTLIANELLFPGGREHGGWGIEWGTAWGFDNAGAGWGFNWGNDWGFDTTALLILSDRLTRGTYPVSVVIRDAAGNDSTAFEDDISVDTYAQPATALAVGSYDSGTDALALSWTASEDVADG